MKHFNIVFLSVLLCATTWSTAQQAGIILNTQDFLEKRIVPADQRHLNTWSFSWKSQVEIKYHDSLYRFLKSELFGFCDQEGQFYRFFRGRTYPILNPGEAILIYKLTIGSGFKDQPQVDSYFFSRDAASDINALSLLALLKAFEGNRAFQLLLEIYYKNEGDLITYDPVHHQYKINRLLELSHYLEIKP